MISPLPPPIHFRGRLWSSEELSALAGGWQAYLRENLPPSPPLIAIVMTNRPEAVALLFALSGFPAPLVVLADDPRSWRSSPPIPTGTPLVLHAALGRLAGQAEANGFRVTVLPDKPVRSRPPDGSWFTSPGVVFFTSGSTGPPKPVYRTTSALFCHALAIKEALSLPEGGGVVGALPLCSSHGLGHVLFVATMLRASLGLVERFDHRSVLNLFASGEYSHFPCTPLMADILSRCPLAGPCPPAPPIIKVSGAPLPRPVFTAFRARFGVPLRPAYGSTEGGLITAETGPPAAIRPESVGQPLPGVQLTIGDDPESPAPRGKPGRVWFTSPWCMGGYGFPPHLEPRQHRGGWWPTGDLGVLDGAGYLTLIGRLDDCFKTQAGKLVNPSEIAEVLRRHPCVNDAAVVPVEGPAGAAIGALVEGESGLDPADLRRHAARSLPAWAQPHVVMVVPELPRLPSTKVDWNACIAILRGSTPP